MGGSTPTPSKPDNTVDVAMLGMQGDISRGQQALNAQISRDALARQNALDVMRSAQPIETQQIDIYGPQGALNQMGQIAAVNAYKSKELEKMTNPYAAAAREELQKQQVAPLAPNYWQDQMQQWGKSIGF
jgi:hypothetical protein